MMRSRLFAALGVIAFIVLAVGLAIGLRSHQGGGQRNQAITLKQGTAFTQGLPIRPFKLMDGNGRPFTNASLMGHWSLLFFGFTRCPMVCPTTLAELSQTYQSLAKADAEQAPQIVFVSVDPERDTTKEIHDYVLSFNPHFIGATGSQASLESLTQNLGVTYAKAQKSGESDYQISHSDTIIVVDPQGHWAGVLTWPHEAKTMATDFLTIQQHHVT